MNVLHVAYNTWPDVAGGAIRTRYLAEAQARMGVRPVVLSAPFQPAFDPACAGGVEHCNGIRYYRCFDGSDPTRFMAADKPLWERAAKLRAFRPFVRRIRQVALEERADVIHAHSLFFCGLAALAAGGSLGLPVVYEVRSLVEEGIDNAGALLPRAYRLLDRLACRMASHVVVLCEGLRGEMMRRGIAPGKITVSGNGVDIEAAIAEPVAAGPPSEAFVIGYIGTLVPYEGLDLLFDAAALLVPQHPELRLLVVGEGPARNSLEERARRLGLENIVRFAGRVAHEEVAPYYRQVDLCVLPRRPGRLADLVTPLKPLEIMAHGKPVLASDCGGHRELITEGVNGMLFKRHSAAGLAGRLLAVMADPEGLGKLGQRAREWVSGNRSWESQQQPVVELYQELTYTAPQAGSLRMATATVSPGSASAKPAGRVSVLLVAPAPGAVPTGGVETGVGMILRSPLAARRNIRLWDRAAIGRVRNRFLRRIRRIVDFGHFAAYVAVKRPSVVHVKSSSGVNFVESALYCAISRALGRRVLFQLHSGEFEGWYSRAGSFGRFAIRQALRWPNEILALSEYWKDLLQSLAPGRPVHIVPNGVAIPTAPALARQAPDCIRVLTIATLGSQKGHFEVFDAARMLHGRPVRFILAGPDGTSERGEGLDVRRWAMVMGLHEAVAFPGPVSQERRQELLAEADIFLLPSRAEGMPNAVLEAMAAGLPVVATAVGAIPEMLGGGRGGVLVPVGDARALARSLLELANDPARREAMGRWNREQVQAHYTFDRVERLLDELYAAPAPQPERQLVEQQPAHTSAKAGAG